MFIAGEADVDQAVSLRDKGELVMIVPKALDRLDHAILGLIVNILIAVKEAIVLLGSGLLLSLLLLLLLGSDQHFPGELFCWGILIL